jgi:hypothetical protein
MLPYEIARTMTNERQTSLLADAEASRLTRRSRLGWWRNWRRSTRTEPVSPSARRRRRQAPVEALAAAGGVEGASG